MVISYHYIVKIIEVLLYGVIRHAFLHPFPSKQNQGSLDPGHQTEHLQHTEAARMTTSGETTGLNRHGSESTASNTNILSGTVLQSAVDTTEVAFRPSSTSNFSFADGVLNTPDPDPRGSAALEAATFPGRPTSTETSTRQDATMSVAHMSNSTSVTQGGCGTFQGCDVGHDGCSSDLDSMQNSFPNGVALAENGLEHSGVGTDQQNLPRYSQLGVGFPGSGGSLDESCTLFNFVYCFFVLMFCHFRFTTHVNFAIVKVFGTHSRW